MHVTPHIPSGAQVGHYGYTIRPKVLWVSRVAAAQVERLGVGSDAVRIEEGLHHGHGAQA